MQEIYIYGCGGVGNEIADHLRNSEKYEVLGFIDDNPQIRECMGYRSRTLEEILANKENEDVNVIISIGEPAIREKVSKRISEKGVQEIMLDLSGYHASKSFVGKGSLLHYNSYISANTTIGKCCMVNKFALIGHDCSIGDYSVICPRVSLGGNVSVGEGTFIGTGAVLRNGICVGKNVIIGMGAVVTKDVQDDDVVFGNPAKFIRKNETRRVLRNKEYKDKKMVVNEKECLDS